MKRILFSAVVAVAALMGASGTRAHDPVKVDPKHYSVVFENDAVRCYTSITRWAKSL
jgi:polyisoprenoid-binding protein YceI